MDSRCRYTAACQNARSAAWTITYGDINMAIMELAGRTLIASRPTESEFVPYYSRYISLVPESDVLAVLETQLAQIEHIAGSIPPDREKYRYAAGKWSIREVFGHLVDGERVFGYRAFCISRGEAAPLPSLDQNAYVAESYYDERSLSDLTAELMWLRKSNLACLRHLTDAEWKRMGTASNNPVSVRALTFIMAGHIRHHFTVLRTVYGVSSGS